MTAVCSNATTDATEMVFAVTELATVVKDGVDPPARLLSAPIIATITESASTESAIAVLDLLVKIALSDLAPTIAMVTDDAMRILLAIVLKTSLDPIAHFVLAPRSALEMVFATTAHASASQDSLDFTAHFQRAHLLALVTVCAFLSELKCPVFATLVSPATIALKRLATVSGMMVSVMAALDMVSALMVSAPAKMDGVVRTAMPVAQEMASVAVETANVLKGNATAIPVGLDMLVIFVLACMTALNTDIATTAPAFARKDTVAVIAPCHLSPSHANAPSIAFVDAFNNAPRSTSFRELDHPTNATLSAHRSACPSVSLVRCL